MPRDNLLKGRLSLANHAYHLTVCTHNRTPIFSDHRCGRILIDEMRHTQHHTNITTLAFVVMPDHLHWLLKIPAGVELATVMKSVKGRSAVALNRHMSKKGIVWQRGFHDHAVRTDEDLKTIARYIIANPLRAGLAKNIGDYPLWDAIWI